MNTEPSAAAQRAAEEVYYYFTACWRNGEAADRYAAAAIIEREMGGAVIADEISKRIAELERRVSVALWHCDECGMLNRLERDTCLACSAPQCAAAGGITEEPNRE